MLQIAALRSALLDVAERTNHFSDGDLRALQQTAEIVAFAIRSALAERDAQVVDLLIATPIGGVQ